MKKPNQKERLKAQERDKRAILQPFRVPLDKLTKELQKAAVRAFLDGSTEGLEDFLFSEILDMLNASTELAYLKGARRSELTNDKIVRESPSEYMPVRFSLKDEGTEKADKIIEYLKRVSGIKDAKQGTFDGLNAGIIGQISQDVVSVLRKKLNELIEKGVHTKGGIEGLREVLGDFYLPSQLETIFRTQSMLAYNAGRWNQATDSASDYIWGYEYVTVHDPRVRGGHRLMEGCRFPKGHPFWVKYFPPNGWNCRCTAVEIWNDDAEASVSFGITGVDPMTRSAKVLEVPDEFIGNAGMQYVESTPASVPVNTQIEPKAVKVIERTLNGAEIPSETGQKRAVSVAPRKRVKIQAPKKSEPVELPRHVYMWQEFAEEVRRRVYFQRPDFIEARFVDYGVDFWLHVESGKKTKLGGWKYYSKYTYDFKEYGLRGEECDTAAKVLDAIEIDSRLAYDRAFPVVIGKSAGAKLKKAFKAA